MHQFFVNPNQIGSDKVVILGEDVRHIKNVLRMQPGDELQVRSEMGGDVCICKIEKVTETEILCNLCETLSDEQELPCHITLFQGLPKSDKMELITQKAVELGVTQIVPVKTARAIMKIDPKKEKNKIARWQAISESAAKQSKRGFIPQIRSVMTFKEALESASSADVKLIPYEEAEDMDKTRSIFDEIKPGDSIAIFIGPEGGFAEEEIALAMEKGFMPITLGKRILRTETAGLAVLSWLIYRLEGLK